MPRYDDYSREELLRLLEARGRPDAARSKGLAGAIVYTWQTGLMAERLAGAEPIQGETIAQGLAMKFGQGRGRT